MNQAIGPGRRAKLTPDHKALLEKRIRGEIPSKSVHRKDTAACRSKYRTAVTCMQEGQWLLQHLQPENTVFNIFRAFARWPAASNAPFSNVR